MILKHHPSIKSTPNVGVHFEARELSLDSFVGWGRKPLSELQFFLSKIAGKDFLRAEDGFLCYQGHPCTGAVRQGLIVDASGIYYDSTKPSDLERMVIARAENPLSEDALRVVRQYINCIVSNGVGKYYERQKRNESAITLSGGALIVEQIYGDCSLKFGGAENLNPDDVIKYALSISKGKPVLFKNHPDLINKKKGKRGFISSASESLKEKLVHLGQDVSTAQALGATDHVVTVTSQFGFEALLASKRVHCFGSPFYAGWGLTEDINLSTTVLSRRGLIAKPTIESLFVSAFYDYTTYVSSQTGELLELNEILTKLTGVELPKLSQFL